MTLTSRSRGRNRRAGVEDRWTKTVRDVDGKIVTVPSANSHKGKRWRARYVDDEGREHAKSFDRRVDAQAWLNEITASQVSGTYVAPRAGLVMVGELHARWAGTQGHLKATTVATRSVTWTSPPPQFVCLEPFLARSANPLWASLTLPGDAVVGISA
jgi:hypothetical protein